jgi:hypothetical protein
MVPAAVLAVAIAIGVAWPYQALVTWVPFIYINVVIWFVFAGIVGAAVVFACSFGHNRNRWIGVLVGLIAGTAAMGASHYWTYRSVYSDVVDELARERNVSRVEAEAAAQKVTFGTYIDARVKTGWSLGRRGTTSGPLDGPFVWLIWGIEALGVLGAASWAGGRQTPFCEQCRRSLDEQQVFVRDDFDLADLTTLTEARSPETLVELPPRSEISPLGLRVTYSVHACASCEGDVYLTIKSAMPKSGSDETDERELQKHVVVGREDYQRLINIAVTSGPSANVAIE